MASKSAYRTKQGCLPGAFEPITAHHLALGDGERGIVQDVLAYVAG
jgi:phosphopantetheine adenylyltransferase